MVPAEAAAPPSMPSKHSSYLKPYSVRRERLSPSEVAESESRKGESPRVAEELSFEGSEKRSGIGEPGVYMSFHKACKARLSQHQFLLCWFFFNPVALK